MSFAIFSEHFSIAIKLDSCVVLKSTTSSAFFRLVRLARCERNPLEKNGRARALECASRPQDLARPIFPRGFLSHVARRTKRKRDY